MKFGIKKNGYWIERWFEPGSFINEFKISQLKEDLDGVNSITLIDDEVFQLIKDLSSLANEM